LEHKVTKEISYELKIRGIKQTKDVDQKLSYDEFKSMVDNYAKAPTATLPQHKFMPRFGHGDVLTKDVHKNYSVVNPKAIIDDISPEMDCYPFGF